MIHYADPRRRFTVAISDSEIEDLKQSSPESMANPKLPDWSQGVRLRCQIDDRLLEREYDWRHSSESSIVSPVFEAIDGWTFTSSTSIEDRRHA